MATVLRWESERRAVPPSSTYRQVTAALLLLLGIGAGCSEAMAPGSVQAAEADALSSRLDDSEPAVEPIPAAPDLTTARLESLASQVGRAAEPGDDPYSDPLRRLARARELVAAGDGAGALAQLSVGGIDELPLKAHVALLRADALLLMNEESKALTELEAVLAGETAPATRMTALEKFFRLSPIDDRQVEAARRVASEATNSGLEEMDQRIPGLILAAADVLQRADLHHEALEAYRRVAVDYPTSPESGDAEAAVDELGRKLQIPALTGEQRLKRAHAFYDGNRSRSLKRELSELRKVPGYDPPETEQAFLAKAWGHALLGTGELEAALGALRSYEDHPDAHPDAVYDLAMLYGRRGEAGRKKALLDAVLESSVPGEPPHLRAVREGIGAARAGAADVDGDWPEAGRLYLEIAELFPDSRRSDEWLFRGGFLSWLSGDAEAAEAAFSREIELFPDSVVTPICLYWRGRVNAAAGDDAAARRDWRAARNFDPYALYGRMAAARLEGADEAPATDASRSPADWKSEVLTLSPRGGAALLLLVVGHADSALAEALALQHEEPEAAPAGILVAVALRAQGQNMKARSLLHRTVTGITSRPRAALPDELWDVAYPRAHDELILQAAKRHRLPPELLYGLVYQESGFEPDATSPSGAMGLMQLMPATARELAGKLGVSSFRTSQAYEPELNIRLGSHYLRELLDRFQGSQERALAGYNAGPSRSRTFWSRLSQPDSEIFVESIPFKQTRLYVKKVLQAKAEYERIYGPF